METVYLTDKELLQAQLDVRASDDAMLIQKPVISLTLDPYATFTGNSAWDEHVKRERTLTFERDESGNYVLVTPHQLIDSVDE